MEKLIKIGSMKSNLIRNLEEKISKYNNENITGEGENRKKKIRVVIPEYNDERMLYAISEVIEFVDIIIVGNKDVTKKVIAENDIPLNLDDVIYIEIDSNNEDVYYKKEEYSKILYNLRKEKGMTKDGARKLLDDELYFAIMMLRENEADAIVSGAKHTSKDVFKPALQIIPKSGSGFVSSFMLLDILEKNNDYLNDAYVFSDCALVEDPNSEMLSKIAIQSAKSYNDIFSKKPVVAMLSYSTLGSANSNMTEKVRNATSLVKEEIKKYNELNYNESNGSKTNSYNNIEVIGEIQLDAAIVPSITKCKIHDDNFSGNANTLIFPDISAGNIGYKLVKAFSNCLVYGPICQGLEKQVADLSRGSSIQDIIGTIYTVVVMAINTLHN